MTTVIRIWNLSLTFLDPKYVTLHLIYIERISSSTRCVSDVPSWRHQRDSGTGGRKTKASCPVFPFSFIKAVWQTAGNVFVLLGFDHFYLDFTKPDIHITCPWCGESCASFKTWIESEQQTQKQLFTVEFHKEAAFFSELYPWPVCN